MQGSFTHLRIKDGALTSPCFDELWHKCQDKLWKGWTFSFKTPWRHPKDDSPLNPLIGLVHHLKVSIHSWPSVELLIGLTIEPGIDSTTAIKNPASGIGDQAQVLAFANFGSLALQTLQSSALEDKHGFNLTSFLLKGFNPRLGGYLQTSLSPSHTLDSMLGKTYIQMHNNL